MRDVVLFSSISIDGFMEAPNRDISWHRIDEEVHQYFNEYLSGMGAFLSGRVTYEMMAEYWPTADANPESSPTEVEFAGIWREMPKYVFSKTLERADWNTTMTC
jgi:dihydrofolate reductase